MNIPISSAIKCPLATESFRYPAAMTARAAMTQAKLSHHASGVRCSPVLVPSGMSEGMPEGMLQDCKTAARLVAKRRETSALSRLWASSEPKFGSPPANRDMDPPSDNVTEKGYTFPCRLSTEERNCSLSGVSHRRCASLSSRACWDDARTMQISNQKPSLASRMSRS